MRNLAIAAALAAGGVLAANPAEAKPIKQSGGLQLSLQTPDASSISDRMTLDVSFRGGIIDAVELYLDGALVTKRQLANRQTRGILSFELETLLLAEGSHDVLVKAFAADGKTTETRGRIRIQDADLNSPVRIAYPKRGETVMGVVPIKVSIDSEIQKQKPYVTFFVDKELKVLRNFPPYEYQWDTTSVLNGRHIVEAWTSVEGSATLYKATPVHVNVNNPGGQTAKQNGVKDLSVPDGPAASRVAAAGATTGSLQMKPEAAKVASARPAPAGGISAEPGTGAFGASTTAKTSAGRLTAPPASGLASPRMMGSAAVQPKGRIAVAGLPKSALPGLTQGEPTVPVIPARSNGSVTVEPGDSIETVSGRTGVPASEIARLNGVKNGTALKPGSSIIVPSVRSFDVAFDGRQIAFDVAPRVENGMPLAPFRQIFEHTGGRLYWFGGSAQTVKAVSETRDIQIKIGNADASVNNQKLSMERKPYILGGRTIVPLSFVRDALNVKVNFDQKTGRLLLQSIK
jgi:LysM repeat protein